MGLSPDHPRVILDQATGICNWRDKQPELGDKRDGILHPELVHG
jgi:hypothetical protein